jgi:uncharacterized membrane protein YcaP (DUF421 family)
MHSLSDAFVGDWRSAVYAALKALALFLTAVAAFRVTERRTLAEFAPFDWVAAVAVGAIVGRSATASDTSWLTGAAALASVLAGHAVLARLRFLPWVASLVDPPLRVLVRDGRIDHRNLRRCGLTTADLEAILRGHQHDLENVHLAIFERKGTVSLVSDT